VGEFVFVGDALLLIGGEDAFGFWLLCFFFSLGVFLVDALSVPPAKSACASSCASPGWSLESRNGGLGFTI
jgi:hypothetical protein